MTTVLEQPRSVVRRAHVWVTILSALWPAGLLLFAAAMKWKQLPVIERMGTGRLHSPYVAAAQIVFEAGLALFLMSDLTMAGKLASRARWVTLATFCVFACVTGYRGLAGSDSCGCFGEFKVNPWITSCLDASVIGLLLGCHRSKRENRTTDCADSLDEGIASSARSAVQTPQFPHYRMTFVVAGMALVIGLTLWRVPLLAAAPSQSGIAFVGNLAILEPEKWIGQPLPLHPYLLPADNSVALRDTPSGSAVNPTSQIDTGRWTAIIYSNECDHCRQFIPRAVAQALSDPRSAIADLKSQSPNRDSKLESSLAVIELPPYSSPGEELVPATPALLHLRLSNVHDWFAQTPVLIWLDNGNVVKTKVLAELSDLQKEPL